MRTDRNRQKPSIGKALQTNQLQLFPDHSIGLHSKEPLPAVLATEPALKVSLPKKRKKRRYFPKIDISALQKHAQAMGGQCLSPEYIDAKTHYDWVCQEGHTWQSTWNCVSRGSWCHECRKWQSGRNRRKYDIGDLRNFAERKGGQCLSDEYVGKGKAYSWRCAGGHIWTAKWGNIIHNNTWCPYCSPHKGERICRSFFEQLFKADFPKVKPDWLVSEKSGKKLELDGYCQEWGIAFEHQGTQHTVDRKHFRDRNHGTGLPSNFEVIQRRDAFKLRACSERGILLLQVPSILEGFGIENVKAFIRDKLLENHYPLPPDFDHIEVNPDLAYDFDKLEDIRRIVEEKGGVLLSEVYISSDSRYEVRCQEGHTWKPQGNNLKMGKWCPMCAGIAAKTLEDVQRTAEQHGGVCLSTAYVNNRTELEFRCKNGHQWFAIPANVLNKGSWCKACASIKQGKKRRKYDLDSVRQHLERKGGRFLSDSFTVAKRTYQFECEKGHTWTAQFGKVLAGDWCPHCAGNARKTIEDLHRAAKAKGGTCLSTEYRNIKTPYDWKCRKGHGWQACADSVLRGSWCGACHRESRLNSAVESSP